MKYKLMRNITQLKKHSSLNTSRTNRIDRMVSSYEQDIMNYLDQEYKQNTSWADRLADKVAAFGGSWSFILIFAGFLVLWMTWNTLGINRFDPMPFILLNLILSFIAAFQAPIIMMSQNRQAARDKHEAIIDFAINYKAEMEIDDIQSHLHRMEEQLQTVKLYLEDLQHLKQPTE